MNVSTADYNGDTIRYIELSDNGLVLNTLDVCRVLKITERPAGSELAHPSLDLASAILVAGGYDQDFMEWLLEKFGGYRQERSLRSQSDDDWNFS